MAKTIADVMTADPRTIEPETTVEEAARVLRDEDVGSLPIVQDGHLVGVLTDRDIVLRVVAEGRDPRTTPAAEAASAEVATVDPAQPFDEGLRLMAEQRVRRLPVVAEDGRLVGVLAQADVALEASPAQTAEVVEEISR